MMERYFEIGGCTVRVTAAEGELLTQSALEPFETAAGPWDAELSLSFAQTLPLPRGECLFESAERRVYAADGATVTCFGQEDGTAYLQLERRGSSTRALARRDAFAGPMRDKTLLRAMEVEHLVAGSGGILLHSAFIAYDGRAILFTAPSGTGKSTQAALWRDLRGACIRNGDRAVIRQGNGGFEAWGLPYCGSSGISLPGVLPLAAVVYLSQAPQTDIRRLQGVQAFRAIWEGCSLHTWDRADVDSCTRAVSALICDVPVYHLACTPDESAVEALENVLLL